MKLNPKLRQYKSALLAGSVISSLVFADVAFAQEAAKEKEVITVTGSRIAKRDNVAESPILTIGAEKLAETGYIATEQFLNTLPQITPSLSSQSNNPSSNGRAFLDLRGLGTSRNLVLIDGYRGMGANSGGTVDINTIPAALIDKVEIITGGAATTYGADAVAGVINFKLKKKFTGIQLDAQYGQTELGDGDQTSASLTMGSNFNDDRGNAVISIGYYDRAEMGKGDRGFAAQASSATGTFPDGSFTFSANQSVVDGLFGAGKCAANGGSSGFGLNPDGTPFCTGVSGSPLDVVGYKGPEGNIATRFYPDFFSYNFEPDNILVLPMQRWNVYSRVSYDLNEYFKPYTSFMFTNYNATSALAPTPAGGATGFTVPVTNPFLTTAIKNLAASRTNPTAAIPFAKRFNALGPRKSTNNFDVWHLSLGATGKLGEVLNDWKYDAYASYGRTILNEIQDGNVRRDKVQQALDAADGGASLCAGGLNLFGNQPISDACKAFISLQAKNLTTLVQKNLEFNISGTLAELPAGPAQVVFGTAWRDLDFDFKPDAGLQPGIVAGFNEQKPVNGYLEYLDIYAEASIPLLKELPFIKALDLNLGARRSNNNHTGVANSFKATLDWSITDALRFRGGYQTAVRAPNVSELFAPQLNNFPNIAGNDPCNTTGTIAATYRNGANGAKVAALCAAQSPVAGGSTYVQPAGQAHAIIGGNPDLKPEAGNSYTLGFVYRPNFQSPWLSGLTATVDYWSISLEEQIAAVGATTIIQRCYNRDGANSTYDINNQWCKLFQRDQSNGSVIFLQQLDRNQAFIDTSGVDLTLNWNWNLGDILNNPKAGVLAFNIVTTWVEQYKTQVTSVDPVYEYVGTIGTTTGSATPEWRATYGVDYTVGKFSVGLTSRFIDDMYHANVVTGSSATSNTGTPDTWYHDIAMRYELTKNIGVRFGVNNVEDLEPRIYSPNIQANTDPSTYDVLGRRYYFGVKVKF